MKKFKRALAILIVAMFALSLLCTVHATTYPRSSKIAMVPDEGSDNGGGLYVGSAWPDAGGFTFTDVSPVDIANGAIANPITAGGYDTVVLMTPDFNFATYWADSDFSSRILSFVNGGGKLILYSSETTSATAFASFIFPFSVDTPGQTGSFSGTLTNLVDDTLSSSNSAADTYPNGLGSYINLAMVTSQTDAVGDLTVMTSFDSHWFIDMFGKNVNNVGGPAHTYAFYGNGLIIFNGLDVDYAGSAPTNANGAGAIGMIWWRELCGQSLGAGPNVNGLTLTPATATNNINTQHTVTATVKNTQNNNPMSGVVVTFSIISGPNNGLTGQATTNANGQATFTWTSTAVGTDTLQASIPNSNTGGPAITSTATKTWQTGGVINPIPEVPLGTITATMAIFAGFASYYFIKTKHIVK
jgi:hypothetical protein